MGKSVSSLLCPFFRRNDEKEQYVETNYIAPKTTQPDIESDTSNVDYIYDNLYKEHGVTIYDDMCKDRKSLYAMTTYDDTELGTRIRYYVLMNGKVTHMI